MTRMQFPEGLPGIRGPWVSALKPPNLYREDGRRLAEVGYVESGAQLTAIEKQYD
jgi:hypothetical protein